MYEYVANYCWYVMRVWAECYVCAVCEDGIGGMRKRVCGACVSVRSHE